jgi:predicted nicotinamide N-methyase
LSASSFAGFVARATRSASPPLCPELTLRLGADLDAVWRRQRAAGGAGSALPPFWSVAWVGGQALARYVLDRPALIGGRTVLDIGSGSGICAIAAAKAGARHVEAFDVDPYARAAIGVNAARNGVAIAQVPEDPVGAVSRWDIVLAGDLWYERFFALRISAWLSTLARAGTLVLLGDCGRAHFPRRHATVLQRYAVPSPESLEASAITDTGVWRLH